MKLGEFMELSVCVTDLGESLPFYERLGFQKLDQSWEPWPWAILTDGSLTLNLSQYSCPSSPLLNYFATDMPARMNAFREAGLDVVPLHEREIPDALGAIVSPGGIGVSLIECETAPLLSAGGELNCKCGSFSEICFSISDLKTSLGFWSLLDFREVRSGNKPFPWAVISDDLIQIGLYEWDGFQSAGLCYVSEDVKGRVELLESEGFEFSQEIPSQFAGVGCYILKPPDEALCFFLEPERTGE